VPRAITVSYGARSHDLSTVCSWVARKYAVGKGYMLAYTHDYGFMVQMTTCGKGCCHCGLLGLDVKMTCLKEDRSRLLAAAARSVLRDRLIRSMCISSTGKDMPVELVGLVRTFLTPHEGKLAMKGEFTIGGVETNSPDTTMVW